MTDGNARIWHVSADLAAHYADGSLPEPDAWSLEKHLESCAGCADRVSRAVRGTAAGTTLAQVREAVLAGAPAPQTLPDTRPADRPTGGSPDARQPVAARALPRPARRALRGGRAPKVPTRAPAPQLPDTRPTDRAAGGSPDIPMPVAARALPRTARLPWAARRALRGGWAPKVPTRAPAPQTLPDTRPSGRAASPDARQPVAARALSRPARLLWAAGPAVRGAWLPAVLVVAAGAMALGHGGGFPGARALLLAVAPVVPVAGVALSYGPHADPLHEITAATPAGGLRLALIRTAAVLAVSLPLLTLTGLLLPASGAPAAAAWLLPGLALTLGTLALASFVGCRAAAGITAGGWLGTVLLPVSAAPVGEATARLADRLARCLDGAATQGAWAAAAVLSAALLAARRPAYDRLARR
ncbi:zf-HC2 domain-containing protein [Streptomyces bungoensis]|uniref:zf-HC2 domain-containing protein n=1 Tax=Streptomyces bungoensis TaxID=285568 RepID=UPI00367A6A73